MLSGIRGVGLLLPGTGGIAAGHGNDNRGEQKGLSAGTEESAHLLESLAMEDRGSRACVATHSPVLQS